MRTCHCDWSFIWNRLMSTIVYTLYLFCAYFNVSNKIRIGYSKCKIPMECEFIFFKYIINLKIDIFETCTMINEVWPYLCGSIERCSLFFVCRTISVQRNKKKNFNAFFCHWIFREQCDINQNERHTKCA